jgi:hypothetical protein
MKKMGAESRWMRKNMKMEKKKKIKKADQRKRIQEKKEQMWNVYARMNQEVKSG